MHIFRSMPLIKVSLNKTPASPDQRWRISIDGGPDITLKGLRALKRVPLGNIIEAQPDGSLIPALTLTGDIFIDQKNRTAIVKKTASPLKAQV